MHSANVTNRGNGVMRSLQFSQAYGVMARLVSASLGALILLATSAVPARAVDPCAAGSALLVAYCQDQVITTNGVTKFSYIFSWEGNGSANIYLPLLDASAVINGTFGFAQSNPAPPLNAIPSLITNPGQIAGIWTNPGGLPQYVNPAALYEVAVSSTGTGITRFAFHFDSFAPIVTGFLQINGITTDDPRLPGIVPEPSSLALLGAAMAGLGVRRRRPARRQEAG
ncbi:MAG: PEP-CTERM sorting domain-containing protein [Proteobacteria bacterium]|nr:PEP-CTERM sorting domain-containing protein [Pseudomonadota bacterium]